MFELGSLQNLWCAVLQKPHNDIGNYLGRCSTLWVLKSCKDAAAKLGEYCKGFVIRLGRCVVYGYLLQTSHTETAVLSSQGQYEFSCYFRGMVVLHRTLTPETRYPITGAFDVWGLVVVVQVLRKCRNIQ